MGGQDGSRGYLVQAIIVLLQSLEESSWEDVRIEPNAALEKIDVVWTTKNGTRVTQIKSSRNQIGKSDTQQWARELKGGCAADAYELVLVGPSTQSVVEMGSFDGVVIPCPKSLDLSGLLNEAAHLLGKFLSQESMHQQSPQMRELIVGALITALSSLSTTGTKISRRELVGLLKKWIKHTAVAPDSAWEQVDFENQRSIENAVAGTRLGPLDVDACPAFSICNEIAKELRRGHAYSIAGTSGCGKSITAWQVARRFQKAGYSIWRPKAFAKADDLLSEVPGDRSLIVVDDAHKYGAAFATRLSESSSSGCKVLLVSTVEDTMLSQVICLSPEKCVQELTIQLSQLGDNLLPIVQQYDDRVGHRSGDIPLERRIDEARKQKKPWEVFWIIRGGWNTARREIESLNQFPKALEVLLWIATSQVISCDAGIRLSSLIAGLRDAGVSEEYVTRGALAQLDRLGLILLEDSIRTKHLVYAHQVLEECFHASRSGDWATLSPIVTRCVLGASWPLNGLGWLLGSGLGSSNAFRFRHGEFRKLLSPLMQRCLAEQDDFGWAAACASRLMAAFDLSTDEILTHADRWHVWATSGNPLAAYFCGDIVNQLINKSPVTSSRYSEILSRPLVERVDVNRLVEIGNTISLEDFYSLAHLLDRMCFSKPTWAPSFVNRLNWDRIRTMILRASSEHANAIDKMIGSLVKLASSEDHLALEFVEAIVPYISRAINEDPIGTVMSMHNVFGRCLPYGPKFLMRGRVPDGRQRALAEKVVEAIEPRAISAKMESAVSRDLEGLAYTLDVIRQVDSDFVMRVIATLDRDAFFATTATDWKEQTGELQQFIRFFAVGQRMEPASDWIRANCAHIRGPIQPLFVLIAPDVAIKFHREGKGVRLVGPYHIRWSETAGAIANLRRTDREQCKSIVFQRLEELWAALYDLSLDSLHHIPHVLKMLFELSPNLFERFVSGINLDDERCLNLVQQLRSNQPKQLLTYRKLAKSGIKAGGKLRVLSGEFLSRLSS